MGYVVMGLCFCCSGGLFGFYLLSFEWRLRFEGLLLIVVFVSVGFSV